MRPSRISSAPAIELLLGAQRACAALSPIPISNVPLTIAVPIPPIAVTIPVAPISTSIPVPVVVPTPIIIPPGVPASILPVMILVVVASGMAIGRVGVPVARIDIAVAGVCVAVGGAASICAVRVVGHAADRQQGCSGRQQELSQLDPPRWRSMGSAAPYMGRTRPLTMIAGPFRAVE